MNEITAKNVEKVTRYRKNGMVELRDMIQKMRDANLNGDHDTELPEPRKVYPEEKMKRDMHYP